MIKVTLGEVKTQEEKPFPKLMKLKSDTPGVFLFKSEKEATCLVSGTDYYGCTWEVGDYSPTTNINFFTDYNEPITLQNA